MVLDLISWLRSSRSLIRIVVVALLRGANAAAEDYVITTVVGGGPNGVPAREAPLVTTLRGGADLNLAVNPAGGFYVGTATMNRVFAVSPSGELRVAAGHGGASPVGDGGLAVEAGLQVPKGLVCDGAGNLFITDSWRAVVRRVDRLTGLISRVAGSGTPGYGGDGGPALSATFAYPSGIALDAAGNLYVADTGNSRVRRVDAATGFISTIAGGPTSGFAGDGLPATSAQLSQPQDVAVDSQGNILIVDTGNGRIRRVDGATGVITTVAGNGSRAFGGDGGAATAAALYNPTAVAVDGQGNLYIADQFNNRVRRVDYATSLIETVVGGDGCGFAGDGGPARDALLCEPSSVRIDAAGELLISDEANGRVRRVTTSSGGIETVAGSGSWFDQAEGRIAAAVYLAYPRAMAVDAAGNVFFTDYDRLRRMDRESGLVRTVTDLPSPVVTALAVDPAGNLAVSESFSNKVYAVDSSTGQATVLAGSGLQGYCGDGGPAVDACLTFPSGLVFDHAGNLFLSDSPDASTPFDFLTNNHRVRRVDAVSRIITTVAGDGTTGPLDHPQGLAVDTADNLFIADPFKGVLRLDAATHALTKVDGFQGSSAVAVDAQGSLFVPQVDEVLRRDKTTGALNRIAGNGTAGFSGDGGLATNASLMGPWTIALDPSGGVLVGDFSNYRIRRIQPVRPLRVEDAAVAEGNEGQAVLGFSVSVVAPGPVTVDYNTTADSAQAGSDFVAKAGQLVFPAGTFAQTISVPVNGDTQPEPNERLFVDFANATGTAVDRSRAVGDILDDDTPLSFNTVAPCRIADTREASGPSGGPALEGQGTRRFSVTGRCGIPATARAVSFNVTVTAASGAGDLRLHPGGTAPPVASVLNWAAGQTRAANAVVRVGATGDLAVRCDQVGGTAHVILDVNGYFE